MRKGIFAAFAAAALIHGAAEAQEWKRVTMSRKVEGDRPVKVELRYAAGHFDVRPSANPDLLYHVDLEYDQRLFEPVEEISPGRITLGTESVRRRINLSKDIEAGEFELELGTAVPLDLDLDFGAVKADIDLGGIQVNRLEVETGASETRLRVSEPNPIRAARASFEVGAASFTARELGNLNVERLDVDAGVGDITLDFTGEWQDDTRVSVDMGLGALEIRVPRGLGVKLTKDTFLASLDTEGLVKRGDAYYSLDYEEADVRLTIDIDAAFGAVEVVWVR